MPPGENAPDFDSIMKAALETASSEVDALEGKGLPSTPAPQVELPASTPAPTPPVISEQAPQAFTPPPSAAPAPQAFTLPPEFLQTQQQTAQALQMLAQSIQQQRQPAEPPPQPRRVTSRDLMRGFEPPDRERGESDVEYAARQQQALLDHYTSRMAELTEERVQGMIRESIEAERQARAQEAVRVEGLRRYHAMLDETLQQAGFTPQSVQYPWLRRAVDHEVQARSPTIQSEQQLRHILGQAAQQLRQSFAPAPAPAASPPSLQVIQGGGAATPPIMGGGGTGPTQAPIAAKPGKPQTFEEMIKNAWETATKVAPGR